MGPNDTHIIIYGYIPSQALSIQPLCLLDNLVRQTQRNVAGA